jgi:hypothetical protein
MQEEGEGLSLWGGVPYFVSIETLQLALQIKENYRLESIFVVV